VPLSSVVEETDKVVSYRITCSRKSETVTYYLTSWKAPETVPDQSKFLSDKSAKYFTQYVNAGSKNTDSKFMFFDLGLYGLDNMMSLNHPQVANDGSFNVKYLGANYKPCGIDFKDLSSVKKKIPNAWKNYLNRFFNIFDERLQPKVWIINESDENPHRPCVIYWTCVSDPFQNSSFFEVFETNAGVSHVFQLKRFTGRTYREQVY